MTSPAESDEPRSRPPRPRLSPDQLVALNADLQLPRAAVCRLATSEEPWWQPAHRTDPASSGVRPEVVEQARTTVGRARPIADEERSRTRDLGGRIVTLGERGYPAVLRDLALPPPVLYLVGALPARPALSVVGARRATGYGRDAATALAGELARRGLTIVSGFARGIDIAAHRAALAADGGATVAVLGCGIDFDYPRGRSRERRRISRRGALLSEFPLSAAPVPQNFPVRNRLIAALGLGTLVVEATVRSGSLITARLALELGRLIYAVPGRIFDDKALGPNALIRDGAFLVQHPRDVLETLSQSTLDRLRDGGEESDENSSPDLPGAQGQVRDAITRGERIGVEEIHRRSAVPMPEVIAALLELEMAGWVRRHPGPTYGRTELW